MEISLDIPFTFRRKCLSPLIPRFLRSLTCWLMHVFFIYLSCSVSLIFILDFICLHFKAIFFSFSFINLRFIFKDFSSMFVFVRFIYPFLLFVSMFLLIFYLGTMISLFFYFLMLIVFFMTIHRNLGHIILFLFLFIFDDRIFLMYLEFKLK